jgi:hypothetical protein
MGLYKPLAETFGDLSLPDYNLGRFNAKTIQIEKIGFFVGAYIGAHFA